jgi:hypothetical protein
MAPIRRPVTKTKPWALLGHVVSLEELSVDLSTILLLIALVLALPGGLFVAYLLSLPRTRFLALLGGIVGDLVAALAIFTFITATGIRLDALSFFIGSFFACSTGVAIGALLADFLAGLVRRGPDVSSLEY